jgi:hypothetical protein
MAMGAGGWDKPFPIDLETRRPAGSRWQGAERRFDTSVEGVIRMAMGIVKGRGASSP